LRFRFGGKANPELTLTLANPNHEIFVLNKSNVSFYCWLLHVMFTVGYWCHSMKGSNDIPANTKCSQNVLVMAMFCTHATKVNHDIPTHSIVR